jgi:hypothetical protein
MATRIQIAKPAIEWLFDHAPIKVYRKQQLAEVLAEHRAQWNLPQSINLIRFLDFLREETKLKEVSLKSEHYADEKRFMWDSTSPYAVALSLRKNSYLTHGSAVFLHGLTERTPKTIYLNYEQSLKPQRGSLTQEGIHRAFANAQRKSNYTFLYEEFEIVLVNGKFTGRLEVGQITGPQGENLEVTKLERTLIDITVRPSYADGVFEVLKAFEQAKPNLSVTTLIATLKKLNYLYPYHQAVGFYMERAGYPESKWSKLLKLGLPFDFYLAHKLSDDKEYDPKWRLYYPRGI